METAVGNTKMAADIAITMLAATAYSRIENIYFRENYPPERVRQATITSFIAAFWP